MRTSMHGRCSVLFCTITTSIAAIPIYIYMLKFCVIITDITALHIFKSFALILYTFLFMPPDVVYASIPRYFVAFICEIPLLTFNWLIYRWGESRHNCVEFPEWIISPSPYTWQTSQFQVTVKSTKTRFDPPASMTCGLSPVVFFYWNKIFFQWYKYLGKLNNQHGSNFFQEA